MPDGSRRTKPKVLILNNENPAWPLAALTFARAMLSRLEAAFGLQGYTTDTYSYFDDLSGLERYDPQDWLVWNWGEELAGQPWSEAQVAAELERLGFAYTGTPPDIFRLVQDRAEVKRRLQAAGLPTLPGRVLSHPAEAAEWKLFPAIVKGAHQHGSDGIEGDSVVNTGAELARRIAYMRAEYHDDALVEPFLDSREFHVAVWGNDQPEALPPLELDYAAFSDMRDRLYTYQWKFDQTSRGYSMNMPCPAPADRPDWQARLMDIAVAAYRLIGPRDYGRVDLRMLGDEPQILDVNANPDLDISSVLARSASAVGISYDEMIDHIVTLAAPRMPARAPAEETG